MGYRDLAPTKEYVLVNEAG
jgi:hypothetical protein